MPWFRTDTKFHLDRRARRALRGTVGKRRDAATIGLWWLAGSWAAQRQTDGFVPSDVLHLWDDDAEALAAVLCEVGLWREATAEGVYWITDWPEHYVERLTRTSLPTSIRWHVFWRDSGICGICQTPADPDDFHVDHIHPVAHGGTDDLSNLQTAHPLCNIVKGARV